MTQSKNQCQSQSVASTRQLTIKSLHPINHPSNQPPLQSTTPPINHPSNQSLHPFNHSTQSTTPPINHSTQSTTSPPNQDPPINHSTQSTTSPPNQDPPINHSTQNKPPFNYYFTPPLGRHSHHSVQPIVPQCAKLKSVRYIMTMIGACNHDAFII